MSDNTVTRKLTAILYADAVGYSRLTGEDESETHKQLFAGLDLISNRIEDAGGRIVHYAGDAVLAEFSSVVAAVEAAVGIQRSLAAQYSDIPDDKRLWFRIGVNLGEVIVSRDDIYGDGVNIAARLESLAEPGGICVSSSVFDQVKGKLDVSFQDMGAQEVKNIAQPVRFYHVILETLSAFDEPPPLPDKPSIAVLPFDNLSGDAEQEYFADGMTEDIITGLSRFRWLFVIARNSSFTFKGKATDVREVAKMLGVRYVLEGSVRRAGKHIRVNGQLIDAKSGNHIWAERYDREFSDVFTIQDEVTDAIVAAIAPEISQVERERAQRKPPENLDAWDLYQRGLAAYYTTSEERIAYAISVFDQVTELDPSFASAFAMGADARIRYILNSKSADIVELTEQAKQRAHSARTLDPRDPIALWTDARVNIVMNQPEKAISSAERAVSLNPNYAMAHYILGFALRLLGRPAEAIAKLDQAIRLSPHDPFLSGFYGVRANAMFDMKKYEECIDDSRRSSRSPNARVWSFLPLIAGLIKLGHENEASKELANLLTKYPDFSLEFARQRPAPWDSDRGDLFLDALREAGVPE